MGIARAVAGLFFPLRTKLGFDARELTPIVAKQIVVAAAETRSFQRATIVLREVGDCDVSANTIGRVVLDVGHELAARRDADPKDDSALAAWPAEPPTLAVVECDGGRIRTRQPGHGPGVHLAGEGWRETKNACLIRAARQTFDEDPQPEPPNCFCDRRHVAKVAQSQALSQAAAPVDDVDLKGDVDLKDDVDLEPAAAEDWRPQRLVRTVLCSLACSADFGRQMAGEAKRRRFHEADARAFLGDGLPWNWSIWKAHFRKFTPILDFIHVLCYLFAAAKAVHAAHDDAWDQYLVWMRGCWQGEVEQVLAELRVWKAKLGDPPAEAADNDPHTIIATAVRYLHNNKGRMDYPQYRRQGLPVTTAWMESLVKEVNYRVKGTEMFWNDPQGGEAILQVRAATLCDDDRLVAHMNTRPGQPFTRRRQRPSLTSHACKS